MINKRRRKNWLKVCKFLCLKCFDRLKYKIYKPKKNHTYVRPFETNENEWKIIFFTICRKFNLKEHYKLQRKNDHKNFFVLLVSYTLTR